MTEAPGLQRLMSEDVTKEELQAAVVKLIQQHNTLTQIVSNLQKTVGSIDSRTQGLMTFGIR